jgi:hypothetical protein
MTRSVPTGATRRNLRPAPNASRVRKAVAAHRTAAAVIARPVQVAALNPSATVVNVRAEIVRVVTGTARAAATANVVRIALRGPKPKPRVANRGRAASRSRTLARRNSRPCAPMTRP